MNFINQYRGLPNQIYILSISRGVISMGLMFIFPFISLLLINRLGYTEIEVGYIMVICSVAGMTGSLLGGKLADKVGRKKIFTTFTALIIVIMLAGGSLCETDAVVILILLTYFAISVIMPVISAMVLDWCGDRKTEALSLIYLASNIGSSLGPILAGLLFYNHMPWIFYSIAIIFGLSLWLTCAKVSDKYLPAKAASSKTGAAENLTGQSKNETPSKEANLIKIVFTTPVLLCFILCLVALTVCYILLDYMLPLQLADLFGLNMGSKYSSLVWTINGLVVVFLTPAIVSFTKKRHQLFNIIFACLLYAVGFSLYGLTESLPVYFIAVVIWTSGEILISTGAGVYISDQSPETHKGRSMGLYELSRGVGRSFGPVLFGYYLSSHTYGQAWILVSIICVIISVVMAVLYRCSPKKRKS